jgi:hypothetical protein
VQIPKTRSRDSKHTASGVVVTAGSDRLLLVHHATWCSESEHSGARCLTILGTEDSLVLEPLEHLVEASGDDGSEGGADPVDPV